MTFLDRQLQLLFKNATTLSKRIASWQVEEKKAWDEFNKYAAEVVRKRCEENPHDVDDPEWIDDRDDPDATCIDCGKSLGGGWEFRCDSCEAEYIKSIMSKHLHNQ
jgi:hypothetical protein